MKKNFVLLCIAVAALGACNPGKQGANTHTDETAVTDTVHNSRNSLDWTGVYKGTLPCADCEGIDVEIRLNKDLTFERVTTYQGKGDNRFTDNGRIEWDENGSRIKLVNDSDSLSNSWFRVEENNLLALDTEGNPIENNLPVETYVFKKTDTTPSSPKNTGN